MSALKYDDVKASIENEKWQLISTSYKNLDTELNMICPKGHSVSIPYKKWRVNHSCPECEKGIVNRKDEEEIFPKKEGTKRLLAIDQATKVSGWAIFDGATLVQYGKIGMTKATSTENIEETRKWVAKMIDTWNPDSVAIEDIHFQKSPDGKENSFGNESVTVFKVLAQLQGVIINLLFTSGIKYDIIHSAKWREYCQIKGVRRTDKKRSAQLKVKEWYNESVTQDEADAICIGKYAVERNNKGFGAFSFE